MPTFILDTEAAELIGVAVEMLQGALTARVRRADPDKVISNSLTLQSNKLKVVLAQLTQPEPPEWSALHTGLQSKAMHLATIIASDTRGKAVDDAWRELRAIAITPGFPTQPAP